MLRRSWAPDFCSISTLPSATRAHVANLGRVNISRPSPAGVWRSMDLSLFPPRSFKPTLLLHLYLVCRGARIICSPH
jgi:hypothetical protein